MPNIRAILQASTVEHPLVFEYIQDLDHGWLQVPHVLITFLEMGHLITRHSYSDATYGYLEEDRDLNTFLMSIALKRIHFIQEEQQCAKLEDGTWEHPLSSIDNLTATTENDARRFQQHVYIPYILDRFKGVLNWVIPQESAEGFISFKETYSKQRSNIRNLPKYSFGPLSSTSETT